MRYNAIFSRESKCGAQPAPEKTCRSLEEQITISHRGQRPRNKPAVPNARRTAGRLASGLDAADTACLQVFWEYIPNIFMATSVHIPKELLVAVDRRAKQLGMSRNRLIVRALERDIAGEAEWSPGFFEKFSPLEREDASALDETLAAVRANRKSKKPPAL
jgi:hypothetical protein